MDRIPSAFTIVVFALLFSFAEKGNAARGKQHFVFGNSNYTFHGNSAGTFDWEESNKHCKETGSRLVSIESKKEWEFLKNRIQNMTTEEYYIGLKKDRKSEEWRWISDNSKVNATRGEFPWATDEPSGDGNCAVMYKNYRQDDGEFNDLNCSYFYKKPGHICEISGFADSTGQEETTVGQTSLAVTSAARLTTPSKSPSTQAKSTEATQPTAESGTKGSATKPSMTQSTSSKYFLTESNSEATPPKNIVKDVPPEETTKNNTKVIVIVLVSLAILILINLIVFYVTYVRRRNFKKQDTRNATDTGNLFDNGDGSSLSPETVARRLGFSEKAELHGIKCENPERETDQSSRKECGYAMLIPHTMMMPKDSSYASLVKSKKEDFINESSVVACPSQQHDEEPHDEPPTCVDVL